MTCQSPGLPSSISLFIEKNLLNEQFEINKVKKKKYTILKVIKNWIEKKGEIHIDTHEHPQINYRYRIDRWQKGREYTDNINRHYLCKDI